jgi:hypothetical protein
VRTPTSGKWQTRLRQSTSYEKPDTCPKLGAIFFKVGNRMTDAKKTISSKVPVGIPYVLSTPGKFELPARLEPLRVLASNSP